MSIRISPIVSARVQPVGLIGWVRKIEVPALAESRGPAAWLEHFQVNRPILGARLNASASAITYVMPDSDTSVRIRDSFGHDTAMRPGGLLWMQAGDAVAHEHLPAESGKSLHCVHVCVPRESAGARSISSVFRLDPDTVPEWRSGSGDHVRVVCGAYAGMVSAASPGHSFSLLDVRVRSTLYFDVRENHHALVYVLSGTVLALSDAQLLRLESGQAYAMRNERNNAMVQLVGSAQLLILAGQAIRATARPRDDAARDTQLAPFRPVRQLVPA